MDPVSAYFGAIDGNDNIKTRSILEPLSELASRLRIATVGVTHLNKSSASGHSALNRFIGSIGMVAASRAAFAVIEDPADEGRRLFLPVKNNLAKASPGLAFRIEQGMLPETDILASRICFEPNPVDINANDALAASEARDDGDRSAKGDAVEFLSAVLADGGMPVKEIERQAIEAGLLADGKPISQSKAIRSAREVLGIKPHREGGAAAAGQWIWSLPDPAKMPSASLRCPILKEGILGNSGHLSAPEGDE